MHPNDTVIRDYVDAALDARQREDVEQHLAQCADCRQLVADLMDIRTAASDLRDEVREAPVRAWTRLERAIAMEPDARGTQSSPSS